MTKYERNRVDEKEVVKKVIEVKKVNKVAKLTL